MKRTRKFLLYFFIILLACYVVIDSVDYPHQHEKKVAAQQNQAELAKRNNITENVSEDLTKPKSFSEEVKSFSRSLDDFVAQIRNLKQGLKTAKCGGIALFQIWKVDRRLDNLPDDLALEAFLETGIKFQDVDIFDFDRTPLTDEQREQYRHERLDERMRRFTENPSQINTRKALKTCLSYQYDKLCSSEQILLLTNNLNDTFDNWITRIGTTNESDTQTISDYMDMAVNSPSDNTVSRDLIYQDFQLVNSITDNPGISVMMTLVGSFSGYGEYNLYQYCKRESSDQRCLVLADKLIREGSSETSLNYGYLIKEHYLRTNKLNIEQANQLQATRLELEEQLNRLSTMPMFEEELPEYIIDTLLNYDNTTAIEMIIARANELLEQDPDMCYF